MDTHPMGQITEEQLRHLQTAPKDEFGITHHDILFNAEEDRVYCGLDAPDRASVQKHHRHAGIECEWVREVKSTRPASR